MEAIPFHLNVCKTFMTNHLPEYILNDANLLTFLNQNRSFLSRKKVQWWDSS